MKYEVGKGDARGSDFLFFFFVRESGASNHIISPWWEYILIDFRDRIECLFEQTKSHCVCSMHHLFIRFCLHNDVRCTVCVCKYDYVIMSITVVVLGHSTETNNRTKNNLTVPNISARWCSVIRNKTLPASLITHRAQNSLFYFSAALCFCELRAFGSTRNRIKNKMSPNCLWSGLWSATLNTLSGFLPFGAVCCLSAF